MVEYRSSKININSYVSNTFPTGPPISYKPSFTGCDEYRESSFYKSNIRATHPPPESI